MKPFSDAIPLPSWVDPSLYPFARRTFDHQGCRVNFVDEGHGPPLPGANHYIQEDSPDEIVRAILAGQEAA